jgi:hypothetical protein
MPTIRVVGGGPPTKEVFVSVEKMPLALADVRKALPALRKELSREFRVEDIEIQSRVRGIKNPCNPKQVVELACVGIAVHYVIGPALKAGVADPVGSALKKGVRRWLKRFDKKSKG